MQFYARTRLLLVVATSIASVAGALLTVSLLAVAMFEMVSGLAAYVGLTTEVPTDAGHRSAGILEAFIRGVELLFLAPLPFLIPVSLGRFIRDSKEDRDDRQSKADLLSIKGLTTALLIAILASDVVRRALGHDGLHYEESISTSLVIGVLAAYYFGLERQARQVKAEPPVVDSGVADTGAPPAP